MTIEKKLICLHFIEGFHHVDQKNKILEHLQGNNMTLEACIEYVQRLEMILDFSETTRNNAVLFQGEKTLQHGSGVLQKTEVKKCNNILCLRRHAKQFLCLKWETNQSKFWLTIIGVISNSSLASK